MGVRTGCAGVANLLSRSAHRDLEGVWRLLFSQVYVCAANAKNLRRRWPVVVAPEMGRSLGRTGGTDYRYKIFVQ